MNDYREEHRRREEDQRKRRRESKEDSRYRERMALEAKRDRAESMRWQGYTERDIRKSERRRGCVPLVLLAVAFGAFAWFSGSYDSSDGELMSEEPSTEFPEILPSDTPQVRPTDFGQVEQSNEEPFVPAELAPNVEEIPSPQIRFESNPVVQPLPDVTIVAPDAGGPE